MAVALLDQGQAERLAAVMQAEEFQGCEFFLAALHPGPEADQESFHILFRSFPQVFQIQVVVP
ncbi:hypothetical protein D3C81_2238860 [compost metagenome]